MFATRRSLFSLLATATAAVPAAMPAAAVASIKEDQPRHFPVGSIVYLKTGSPPLLVNDMRRDSLVSVEWFVGATLYREAFDPECVIAEMPQLEWERLKRNNNFVYRGIYDATGG